MNVVREVNAVSEPYRWSPTQERTRQLIEVFDGVEMPSLPFWVSTDDYSRGWPDTTKEESSEEEGGGEAAGEGEAGAGVRSEEGGDEEEGDGDVERSEDWNAGDGPYEEEPGEEDHAIEESDEDDEGSVIVVKKPVRARPRYFKRASRTLDSPTPPIPNLPRCAYPSRMSPAQPVAGPSSVGPSADLGRSCHCCKKVNNYLKMRCAGSNGCTLVYCEKCIDKYVFFSLLITAHANDGLKTPGNHVRRQQHDVGLPQMRRFLHLRGV